VRFKLLKEQKNFVRQRQNQSSTMKQSFNFLQLRRACLSCLPLAALTMLSANVAAGAQTPVPKTSNESFLGASFLSDVRAFGDVRLRYENFDASGVFNQAQALTARVRSGAEVNLSGSLSVLGEIEGVLVLDRSGPRADEPGPFVPDRDNLEFNRLQVSYNWGEGSVTGGRQAFAIGDGRLFASPAFRQNQQTYDAMKLGVSPSDTFLIELGYVWQVNRSVSSRFETEIFKGNTLLASASADTPIGLIRLFHMAMDLDDGKGLSNSQLRSNVTSGFEIDGRHSLGQATVSWRGSFAHQENYAGSPITYTAEAYRLKVGVETDVLSVLAGHESLGDGGALAFQAPLGANHAFLGDADIFLSTPQGGLRETHVSVNRRLGDLGALRNVRVSLRRHWFESDRESVSLGKEWDAGLQTKISGINIAVEVADYQANTFASDTQKVWVTLSRDF